MDMIFIMVSSQKKGRFRCFDIKISVEQTTAIQKHWNNHMHVLNVPAEQSSRQTKTSLCDYIWTYLSGKHKQCDEEDK